MGQAQIEFALKQAAEAISRREGARARALIRPVVDQSETPGPLFLLAQACRVDGDVAAEREALDRLLKLQPNHIGALLMKGSSLAQSGVEDEAIGPYRAALSIAQQARQGGDTLPPTLVSELGRAAQWVQAHIAERSARIDQALAGNGFGPGKRSERIDEALAILRGQAPVQLQQPSSFYFPGLPQRSFYEREEFDWVPAIEAECGPIRSELEALLQAEAEEFSPYVAANADRSGGTAPNAHLAGDTSWSAYHLLRGGEPVAGHAERFPATLAALARAPLPYIAGRSPMALFSLLKADSHIRPHHGLFNFRLICHLPLIVPGDCMLRVGNQQRPWQEGQMLIFDDSMEHEAWNRSDRQRIILLFEIWRPEISKEDREALTVLLEAANISAED